MTNDKLKEAIVQAFELEKAKAYKCCESCGIKFSNADTYFHYGFLAGAAYIRETEVNALLEIVESQRETLKAMYCEVVYGCPGCDKHSKLSREAIKVTDEKLKSLGVEI